MTNIQTIKKVIGIANSIGVTIDKSISKSLNINKGDMIMVSFKKIRGKK